MKKYKKFYISYEAHVVFTENGKQYTRKLYTKDGKTYIRFNNQKIEISENDIYM